MNNDFDINKQTFENYQSQPRYVTYIPYGLTPETFEERKKLRKTANIIGGSLLIMLAISSTFVFVLRLVLGFLGLWNTQGISFLSEPATLQFLQAVLSIIMFTVPFVLLFKAGGFRISGLIKFKKPKKEDILPFILLGVSFCAFSNIAVNYLGNIFAAFGIEYNVDYGPKPDGILGFMLTFIATAIVPPLVEEFACRGLILGSLRKFGDGFAIMCSAIVFGIMHGNFQQMPFAFLVGLILGYITIKSNTIWLAVAVHFFNNALSVILDYAIANLSQMAQASILTIYFLICLLIGFIGIYLLRDRKEVYTLKKPKNKAEMKQIYKWFFTSPTIIIFIILSVIEALAFFR